MENDDIIKSLMCSHCGYEWDSKSKLDRTTCPNCGSKVNTETSCVGTKTAGDNTENIPE